MSNPFLANQSTTEATNDVDVDVALGYSFNPSVRRLKSLSLMH